MKRKTIALLCIALSLIFSVICIGYASLSDNLTIDGSAEVNAQEGVFITDVAEASGLTANQYISTTLSSTIVVPANSSVTIEITVHNNYDVTYAYNDTLYVTDAYDNNNVTFTIDDMKKKDEIASGAEKIFHVTFKNSTSTAQTLNSILNFQFVLPEDVVDDEDQIAAKNALEQFQDILDKEIMYNKSEVTAYDAMLQQMENGSGRGDNDYISNVVGASSADKALLNDIFEDKLRVNIDGKEVAVTALIKGLDTDENGNFDVMVLFMTTSALAQRFENVSVYAAVFAVDENNVWSQLGEMYNGSANACGYNGSYFGTGSFNSDNWKSNQVYVYQDTTGKQTTIPKGSGMEDVLEIMGYPANLDI
ncbi:MAG: hypothetical protein J6B60_04155 [Clostridia bacterium]|nr:hypothetical protein [Clostridia bacterium]